MSTRLEAAVAELVEALREELRETAPRTAPAELLSVEAAAERAGIGRSLAYQLIGRGELRSIQVGRRRLVPADAIAALASIEGAAATNGSALEVDRRDRSTPPAAA